MFRNYFKAAWRALGKSKVHSFINITGLSIGMAVAMLIGLWIYSEISFNKNFDNYDRIAMVVQNVTNNGEVQTWKSMPYPLANELRTNYGRDFKHIAMVVSMGDHMVAYGDKKLTTNGGYFEPEAADMFSLQMLKGDRKALNDPSSILLSESAAKAYFGDADPMNKIVRIDNQADGKVAGVYKNFPYNCSFADVNFIAPWQLFFNNADGLKKMEDPWRPNFTSLFVQLNDNVDINQASAHIRDAKLKKVNPQLAKKKPTLFLDPMSRWHLYAEYKNGVNVGGDIQYVWMFGIIGVFVLLLACINFMNLSTARSETRAKEVGIRKTIGSLRRQLVFQFFSESILTVLFAFALSLLLVQLTLSFFNQVADKKMSILWSNPGFWLLCLLFMLITGIIAGSYPAFYLSSFSPVKVLKGTFKAGRYSALPRKILVVMQFTVSVTLIICVIIVYQQIQFAKNRPVGYSREGLVSVPTITPAIHDHFNAVKDELVQTGAIVSIAEAGSAPTDVNGSTSGLSWRGKDPNLSIDFQFGSASYDYGKTIGWKIKEGRDFSRDFATDSSALILNEEAVHFMGLKNPVGEIVTWWDQQLTVIGVVEDMVMQSPYDEPKPMVYSLSNDPGNVVMMRINPSISAKEALARVSPVFKKFNPEQPFEYKFADEEYAKKFDNEERVGKLAGFFAILAVAISCLGLFGLASFVAEQRTKEIGVRKVLGASVFNVWQLLSKDFVMLVMISFFIAVPLAYYFMHSWLQNYDYRTGMSWWIFALAGLGSLMITVFVVSFQSVRAAVSNPVAALRSE